MKIGGLIFELHERTRMVFFLIALLHQIASGTLRHRSAVIQTGHLCRRADRVSGKIQANTVEAKVIVAGRSKHAGTALRYNVLIKARGSFRLGDRQLTHG